MDTGAKTMTRYHSIALVMISGLLACPAQVTGAADLSITKDDGVTSVTPGDPVTYTITVTNHGPSPVLAAYVEDIFSSKLKNVSWNAVGTGLAIYNPSGTDDITELVFLPPGAAITYNVTATVKPAASGTLFNTATIWSLQYDPDTSNNLASDNDTLTTPLEEADLVVTKDDGQATAERGEALAYTITVTNAGPDDANDVIVTDNFPAAALMNVNWTAAGTGGASGFPASGSGNINHTVDLPAGATITYGVTAVVQPFAPSSVINTATVSSLVSDPDPGNNVATDIDAVTGSPLPDADLVVTKDDGQDIVAPGDPVTYTIGITNVGPDPAVDVTVMDPKPAELLNMTWGAVGSGGATGFSATGTGSINDSGITLPPGGTVTYTVTGTVDPNATGALTNTVGASSLSADPDPSNNIASDTDAIIPPGKASDLAITKDDGQTSAVPGEPVVYTITVTNNGPNADVAFVSDIFSSKFAAVGWTAVGSGGAVYLPSGMGDINEGLLLPSGATVTYTVIRHQYADHAGGGSGPGGHQGRRSGHRSPRATPHLHHHRP